jgi:hypothetical protein
MVVIGEAGTECLLQLMIILLSAIKAIFILRYSAYRI